MSDLERIAKAIGYHFFVCTTDATAIRTGMDCAKEVMAEINITSADTAQALSEQREAHIKIILKSSESWTEQYWADDIIEAIRNIA